MAHTRDDQDRCPRGLAVRGFVDLNCPQYIFSIRAIFVLSILGAVFSPSHQRSMSADIHDRLLRPSLAALNTNKRCLFVISMQYVFKVEHAHIDWTIFTIFEDMGFLLSP